MFGSQSEWTDSHLPYNTHWCLWRENSERVEAAAQTVPLPGGATEGERGAECNSAIQHSAAKPQSKERGVYAASTLEVPQAVKRAEGLENLNLNGEAA
jgi:hypothetical protein